MIARRISCVVFSIALTLNTGCAAMNFDFCACEKEAGGDKSSDNKATSTGSSILPKVTIDSSTSEPTAVKNKL